MIVIADTTPINYLVLIKQVDILNEICSTLCGSLRQLCVSAVKVVPATVTSRIIECANVAWFDLVKINECQYPRQDGT